MVTEDYVSFDTAKLLKEKGFNEPCASYDINGDKLTRQWNLTKENYYPRCTIQMAMKWIREEHNIIIEISSYYDNEKYIYDYVIRIQNHCMLKKLFLTYEQACESAIKYCLENLI